MEEWADIVGYEDRYEVSTHGRVRSKARMVAIESSRWLLPGFKERHRPSRIRKLRINKLGYPVVNLYNYMGRVKLHTVHRLVALAFVDGVFYKAEVNHKDGDKSNNHVTNLEWVTRTENSLHSTRVLKQNIGSKQAFSKLKEEDVLAIKDLLNLGYNQTYIATLFGVTNHAIHRIQHGYNWSWLTGFGKEVQL